ncbi:MAG: DUF11 domain-containing protein [Opitutaceae bacterium]|nr:DUF11 domain-containing protein [Opitutaceae bacterium]
MKRLSQFILYALALVMVTGVLAPWVAAQTPTPGTVLRNQASLTYHEIGITDKLTLYSDTVRAVVTAGPGIDLQADRKQQVAAGVWFTLAHTLTNTGNQAGDYTLTPSLVAGGDFAVQSLALVLDANANGMADVGETRLAWPVTHQITLLPGESSYVIIVGQVSTAATGSTGEVRFKLDAALPAAGLTAENEDLITLAPLPSGDFNFTKTASAPTATRGSTLDYTLSGANTLAKSPGPIPIIIDGVNSSMIVVRDVIPATPTFVGFLGALAPQSKRLYHVISQSGTHTYTTTAPADLSTVDAVAVAFPAMPYGYQFRVNFRVRVNDNAANLACGQSSGIVNIGELHYHDGTKVVILKTNGAGFSVPARAPVVKFYMDEARTRETRSIYIGKRVYIGVDAASENADPRAIDTLKIDLMEQETGDAEKLTAVETGPNTGIFQVPGGVVMSAASPVSGDGVIQTAARHTIKLTLEGQCGVTSNVASILVDPSGIIFDSQSCQPVAGVWVSLIDVTGAGLNDGHGGAPGGLAEVYVDALGQQRAPNPVRTDAKGEYQFPYVYGSVYRLVVSTTDPGNSPPPPASIFPPSALPPAPCSADLRVGIGSRQEEFTVSTSDVFLDIPLDLDFTGSGFGLKKEASQDVVERGDSLVYSLTVSNDTSYTFKQIIIDDVLPAGLTYEPGSARLERTAALPDPAGGRGPRLSFTTGADIEPGKSLTLNYRVRVERDAPAGDATNIAVAHTGAGIRAQTMPAASRVRIEEGVFTDKGVIIGTIFVDENRNRVQDDGEPGVPGVRFYLEDGTFVVSDSEGKYSLYGVRPITHVMKLDRTTLPAGAELLVLGTRNAADAGSRFLDMKNGELHKANFAIAGDDAAVLAEVMRRREQGEVEVAEITAGLNRQLDYDARDKVMSDPRTLPAQGMMGAGGPIGAGEGGVTSSARSTFAALLPKNTLNSDNSAVAPAPVAVVPVLPLPDLVADLHENTAGFIDLADGDTVAGQQITVRVKGPLGSNLKLSLNGQPVSATRVGTRVVDPIRQVEALEFIGLDLQPGPNRLELVTIDPFGNERARVPIAITAPDQLADLAVSFSNPEPAADGHTPVKITVRLLDRAGTLVSARTPLTLEASLGRWQAEDLNERTPGVQVFIEGGEAVFTLLPPDAPGDGQIVISSGPIKHESQLPFLPDLRPLIASGIIEGRIALRDGAGSLLRPQSAADAFEDELYELSRSGDLSTHGRVAFFLKGKIKGGLLLTAAYDTDKRTRERLFRDIEPDKYYPVYGDASIRGYDAQSSRRLYLRIDHKRSYLLVGDFQTRVEGEQSALGNYQRALNGARMHFENARGVAEIWASRDTTRQVVEELAADGTSGPYLFRTANGLINSERVEILTRDRNQPSLVLKTEPMSRFRDYDFEPFTGRLLFHNPVRSLDENLNPRSIRIVYEVDQGGDPFWVYGANTQVRVAERLEVGGTYAEDRNPADHQRVASANATVKLGEGTYLLGELARSDTDLQGSGLSGRVDLRHHDEKTDARIYYGETATNFVNPGALLMAGRVEAGAKVTRQLTEQDKLIVQGLLTEDTTSAGGTRQGVRADVEHTFPNRVKLEVGARKSEETGNPAGLSTRPGALQGGVPGAAPVTPFEVNSVRVKVTAPLPKVENVTVFGELEQDVVESDQQLAALGGDWQFSERGRAYARHEFISSIGGPFELNQIQQNNITVVGFETDYLRDGQLFNEYRARDAFNGREAEAATGLRHGFQFESGLRLQAGVERVTPFDGTTQNESTAITTGLEYTENPLWKGTARVEARFTDQNESLLNSLGYARKLSTDWTFLAKTIYYQVDNKAAATPDSLQARILTGLAWRETRTDQWNALGKYEYRYEDGSPFDPKLEQLRRVHIFSGSVNYQPTRDWIFSGRYAFKVVDETVMGDDATYVGQQIGLRALREISKRWDAGLSASVGWSRGFDRHDWALGPEVGYNFKANMRLGLGYNIVGFHDRDLTGDLPTQRGVFLNLRLKFDEGFFALRALADDTEEKR